LVCNVPVGRLIMVSVVNGYVCFSSCDEAKARRGNDPNPVPGAPPDLSDPKKKSAFAGQPPVILDGVLKGLANGASPPGASNIAGDTNEQPALNILA
jgi:hypothetical protein